MAVKYYPAIVEGDESSGFCVFFPDLPGCTSAGADLQAAALNAEVALGGHLRLMLEDGDPIPEPSDLRRIPADPEVQEAARILVRAALPGRSVRVNVSMDEDLLAQIDAVSSNRSAFLAEAARAELRSRRAGQG
ncbi:type II toxin-antitoxin system HicB family antitoxin [Caenispirillum bisanense]|uniref:type II toxin-antitoxin system HicB family antitoxin n=1 Tax=Caenispirillum bisanense TaxID=414052 RepID=UPI0031E01023